MPNAEQKHHQHYQKEPTDSANASANITTSTLRIDPERDIMKQVMNVIEGFSVNNVSMTKKV